MADLEVETRGYFGDQDHEYNVVNHLYYDRDYTGLESDARSKTCMVELEYLIEEKIGAKRIADGKMKMYKGTVKKWQVLDDNEHDSEQIEKLQASIQAPLPEELEMYKEKHDKPMTLPVNNENARLWRDEAKYNDSAEFDPDFLSIDRERRKKFFIERYEQPKQLE